jgi:hypothetical protein
MGQYYIIANTLQREFIHPHVFGAGLKHMEIASSSSLMYAMSLLIVQSDSLGGGDWGSIYPSARDDHPIVGKWAGDPIMMVGDYDASGLYDEARNSYTDVSMPVFAAMCRDSYWRQKLKGNVAYRLDPTYGSVEPAVAKLYADAFAQPSFVELARKARGLDDAASKN